MSAQWMVPSRSETDYNFTLRPQQITHQAQDCGRVGKMFKSVNGNYDIGKFFRMGGEQTKILNPGFHGLAARCFEDFLADIKADHSGGPL